MGIIMVLIIYIPLNLIEGFYYICLFTPLGLKCKAPGVASLHQGRRLSLSENKKAAFETAEIILPGRTNKNSSKGDTGSDYMSYYLAGLLEGDGHFNTPVPARGAGTPPGGGPGGGKKLKTPSGTARLAGIETVFALKDRPSAVLLQSLFGGKVYDHADKKMTRWLVQDKNSVINIINLINGKFRTPKINSLYDMIDFLNAKGASPGGRWPVAPGGGAGANITKLPLDTSPLNNNAWLSGFIDADGHFAIKGFTTNPKSHLGIQFQLSQRASDRSGESLEKVMLKITEFLLPPGPAGPRGSLREVNLNRRIFSDKYHQFVVSISNRVSNKILIDYLNTYPLLSSKYLDFKDWETAYNIYVNKLHKDPIQYEKVRQLKANMNRGRTYFSWSHHKHILSNGPPPPKEGGAVPPLCEAKGGGD
jgi:LAGLIDADG endonuclease